MESQHSRNPHHDDPAQRRSKLKVWVLTNAPSPYQVELFAAINRLPDTCLSVRYMSGVSPSGKSESCSGNLDVMAGFGLNKDEYKLHPRALWEALWGKYDCYVLSGFYTSLTFQLCALILRFRRAAVAVWLERPRSNAGAHASRWSNRLRQGMQKWTLGIADRIWCIGSLAKAEYAAIAGSDEKMLLLPYCCDTSRFQIAGQEAKSKHRSRLKITDEFVFLFSGQIIPRKGVDTLLRAFEKVAAQKERVRLLVLGDGPLRDSLQANLPATLQSKVEFFGKVQQSELPSFFHAADAFVFPSRHDGWGVVINEACAAGLPIIATPQTGASHDLLRNAENGYVVDRDDVDGFANAMTSLIDSPDLARQFGIASRNLVESFSASNGATRFVSNVEETIKSRNK
jgi:glycosyltransferase involved in cell wall biosynthesis